MSGNVMVYLQLADLKNAPASEAAYVFSSSTGPVMYGYVAGDFTGKDDEQSIIALNSVPVSQGALVRQSGQAASFIQDIAGSQVRSVSGKLGEYLSVFDFMTPIQVDDVVRRSQGQNVTAAVQACFDAATLLGRTVYLPDGVYLVSNLLFGQNQIGHQNPTPLGLVGQSKSGARFSAAPGTTGTVLQAWSCSAVTFRDFQVEGNGVNAKLIDWDWKGGIGPSTINIIDNILVRDSAAPVVVSLNDLNDTEPQHLYVGVNGDDTQCLIEALQTGGMAKFTDCQWPGGYLRVAAQNVVLDHCLGMGVEFAEGGDNYVTIIGGQMYANKYRKCIYWSDKFDINAGLKGFKNIGTFYILDNGGEQKADYVIDLNIYSAGIEFENCGWLGYGTPFLAPTCKSAYGGTVIVKIRGGSAITSKAGVDAIIPNDTADVVTVCEGVTASNEAAPLNKNWEGSLHDRITLDGYTGEIDVAGGWLRQGNIVTFTFRAQWTGIPGGQPFLFNGLPFSDNIGVARAATRGLGSANFAAVVFDIAGSQIVAYNLDETQAVVPPSGDITISGTYSVRA